MPFGPLILAAESTSGFVYGLLVILGAAGLVSIFLRRLHLAAIPGYLIVGAIIGAIKIIRPPGEGESDPVAQISDLAIVMLMFTIGMHMDLDSIRFGMLRIFIVGAISTLVMILIGWVAGLPFGLGAPAALVIAMALSMSSTAVVLGILNAKRELHRIHGRLCVGIALIQDLIAVGVLGLLPPIALWATGKVVGAGPEALAESHSLPGWAQKLSGGLIAIGGITLMVWFGRVVLPRMLREAGKGGNAEGMLVVSAAAALAAAVLTSALGFGPALGAFLAGFLLSGTPFRHQLAGQLSPMRDLFMAVFFTSVGVEMNLGAAVANFWIIGIALILLVLIKSSVVSVACWAGGATASVAALTGLLLAQAGEFSLVVLQAAQSQGIISDRVQSVMIAIVVLSLIITNPLTDALRPHLGRLGRIKPAAWITNRSLREPHEQRHDATPSSGTGDARGGGTGAPGENGTTSGAHARPARVIVAGFGVVGRNIAEHLAAHNMDYTIVDMNPQTIERQAKLGKSVVFGDISNADVLESAGIREASAVVLTIPDDDATVRACRMIRELRPDIFIAARTTYLSQAITATDVGADHVTIEEVVTAQDMAIKIIAQLGKRMTKATTPHL